MSAQAPAAPLPTTVGQALERARSEGLDRLDAQVLLGHRLGRSRAWLLAHDTDAIDAGLATLYLEDIAQRRHGVPVAYLVGEREFHGLALRVTPAVLVPRPDTETLVEWALQCLRAAARPHPEVLDLGTGSGAIALALAHGCPGSRVCATDASAAALHVALDNARRLGLSIDGREGSWWGAVAGRRFDLAVSNPPYIAEGDPHLPSLCHEPLQALVSGADGLRDLRAIVDGASAHLRPGAWLLLEHGAGQAEPVRQRLVEQGFVDVDTRHDIEGRPRCTGGRWPGATA